MSKDVLKQIGNSSNIPFKTFECDTEEDKSKIELQGVPMGSRCFVIETGKTYALNSEKQWKPVPGATAEGNGDGATFTPTTKPVEDGNELSWTNDKGKPNPAPVVIKDGKPGVFLGKDAPVDSSAQVWIDTDGQLDEVVSTAPQTLTPEQKKQVLTNIGAQERKNRYELIEDFTAQEVSAFERTVEPDGTPYSFSDAVVLVDALNSSIPYKGTIFISSNIRVVNSTYMDAKQKPVIIASGINDNGLWRGMSSYSTVDGAEMYSDAGDNTKFTPRVAQDGETIYKVQIYGATIGIGTKIKIWAVRA